MKVKLLICVCILAVVISVAPKSYACCQDPVAYFTVWPATEDRYVCIDDSVTFSAWAYSYDPDGCGIKSWSWSFGRDAYDCSDGNYSWEHCRYSTVGDRDVTLTVTDNDSSCWEGCVDHSDTFERTITVVEVASLEPDVGTEFDDGDADPDTKSFAVCIADTGVVTVTATPNPSVSEQNLPGYGYSWGWTLEGGNGTSLLTRTVDRTTPGVTTIACECGSSSKTTKIYVVKVDLDIAGVADANEEDPGGYVALNDDDDNNNGVADKDESGTVTGENDLVSITLSILPSMNKGEVKLEGPGSIKVWENSNKGTPVSLPKTWDLSSESVPGTLYVEGVSTSSSLRDVELKLSYIAGTTTIHDDKVRFTVVQVDLDMSGVADNEEENKGGFIALNDDDDDDNHTADKDESGPITGEDNLVQITLQKVLPTALTGNVTLVKVPSDSTKIKIWENATKGGEPINLPENYNTPADLPENLHVEGFAASASVRDVILALEFTVGGKTFDDKVKVTVIDVQSIAVDNSDSDTHKILSVLNASQIPDDHFVTAEGTGNIVLLATITPNTEETRDTITWTGMTQDGSDKLKATKSRTASGKYQATVNVSGTDARDLTNWVVWSTASSSSNAKSEDVRVNYTRIRGGYNVTHTIIPADIITQTDRPNLSGSKSSDPPDVPGGDTGVYHKGVSLAGGADKKWDSSRQLRQKILNPDSLSFPGDAKYWTTYLNYPSDGVCGNDDAGTGDPENNDPYNTPYQGAVYSYDYPSRYQYHSEGALNNTFEVRIHMQAFARLNLGSTWYRISGWYLWKTHLKFKKQNESEATWNMDFNVDGDMLDTVPVWRDNGSFIALDNNGF